MNLLSRKLLTLILSIAALVAFSVSTHAQGIAPKTPEVLKVGVIGYTSTEYRADVLEYDAAMSAKDFEKARELRNKIVYKVRATVNGTFGDFISKLFQGRAAASTALDILESGLTGLISLTGKEGWAAVLGIVKGGRASFDKNFFNAQTMAVIITNMKAARLRVLTSMDSSLANLSVQDYPLAKGLDDCVELFNAGTLQGGLTEASQSAGANLQAAEAAAASTRALQINAASERKP